MNYIFYFLIVFSIIAGALNGRLSEVVNAILSGAELSVKIALSLIGIMAFWLGMMEIAKHSGLTELLAKLLKPIAQWLFKDVAHNDEAVSDIAMSFSANALGLTNAATPIGLKAMEELQKENNDTNSASDSMCMFLAINTAGFQIVPAVVIAILSANGMSNPTQIILPTLIVTTIAFVSAIFFAKRFEI